MSPLRLAADGDAVAVIAGAGVPVHRTEERNWADLVPDMIRVIGDKLLGDDVADYISMRAVCSSWRSSNDKPTWETKYYPRNWVKLLEDEDEDEEGQEQLVARRFVNVRTGAMLRILLPSFDEDGRVCINAEGLHLIYNEQTDRMRLINPLTRTMADFPGLSHLEKYVSLEFAAAGIIFDENAPASPTLVLAVVLTPYNYGVILCAKPGDEHWGAVDTSAMEVDEDGQTRPSLQGSLSLHGQFYVPTRDGDVLRVELLPHPRLVYVARLPPPHCRCNICSIAVIYLVPTLDSGAAEDKDDTAMVRVFGIGDDVEIHGIHFATRTYRRLDNFGNRTIFVPGVTVQTDRFASLFDDAPPSGSVRINDYIV